jgi:hypothetical protein
MCRMKIESYFHKLKNKESTLSEPSHEATRKHKEGASDEV